MPLTKASSGERLGKVHDLCHAVRVAQNLIQFVLKALRADHLLSIDFFQKLRGLRRGKNGPQRVLRAADVALLKFFRGPAQLLPAALRQKLHQPLAFLGREKLPRLFNGGISFRFHACLLCATLAAA
mgnify:CR=1 FL=1